MKATLWLCNRQRTRAVDLRLLRRIARELLERHFPHDRVALGLHLVGEAEMTALNTRFLHHAGSTDVLAFDYVEQPGRREPLWADLFLCVDEAVRQARRYRTAWPEELARYLIHGLLHLHGHDDHSPTARRRMKREEDRLLRKVRAQFALGRLARPSAQARRPSPPTSGRRKPRPR